MRTIVCNMNSEFFVQKRKSLGLSQVSLATLAGISLPTLQNIEAGKANPSWDVVTKLSKALKIKITLESDEIDWALVCSLGVPMMSEKPIKRQFSEAAESELKRVYFEIFKLNKILSERELEALIAYAMALRDHEPTYFKTFKKFVSESELNKKIKQMNFSRLIKLRRIALAQMQIRNDK